MRRKYSSWVLIFFLISAVFSGLFVAFDNDMVVSATTTDYTCDFNSLATGTREFDLYVGGDKWLDVSSDCTSSSAQPPGVDYYKFAESKYYYISTPCYDKHIYFNTSLDEPVTGFSFRWKGAITFENLFYLRRANGESLGHIKLLDASPPPGLEVKMFVYDEDGILLSTFGIESHVVQGNSFNITVDFLFDMTNEKINLTVTDHYFSDNINMTEWSPGNFDYCTIYEYHSMENSFYAGVDDMVWTIDDDIDYLWDIDYYSFGDVAGEPTDYINHSFASTNTIVSELDYTKFTYGNYIRQVALTVTSFANITNMDTWLRIGDTEVGNRDSYYSMGDNYYILVWEDVNLSYFSTDLTIEFKFLDTDTDDYIGVFYKNSDVDGDGDKQFKYTNDDSNYNGIYDGATTSNYDLVYQVWYSAGGGTGNVTVNVYNETSPSVAIPNWSMTITDKYGNIYYNIVNQNNPVVVNTSVYGFGTRYFIINATNYSSRTYYASIANGVAYSLVAYLPYVGISEDNIHLYYIQVVDSESQYVEDGSIPIYDAGIIISKTINGSVQEISSGFTNSYGMYYAYLIPGDDYYINISKTGYDSLILQALPADPNKYGIEYPIIYILSRSSTSGKTYDDFYENISIDIDVVSAGCNQLGNITITYLDSNSSTTNTQMQLWEISGPNSTLLNTWTNTSNSFFNINSSINTSRTHYLILYFNNTAEFIISQPVTIMIPAVDSPTCGLIDPFDLDDRINKVFGPFSIMDEKIPWPNIISVFIPIIVLVSFGPYNTGIGIIGCGISMTMIQGFLSSIVIGGFDWAIIGIGAFIVILGILYIMTKGVGGDRL